MNRPGMPLRLQRSGTHPQSHERTRMAHHHTKGKHQLSRRRQAIAQALKVRTQYTNSSQLTARERYQHMTTCQKCGTYLDWQHGDPTDDRTCKHC